MSEVVVYGMPISTYVRTVRMALEEKEVPYSLEPLEPHTPEIEALHPAGKVPAFRHGKLTLFETSAICAYVGQAFDGPPLEPEDAKERAVMNQWISFYNDVVYPAAVGDVIIQRLVVPKKGGAPDEDRIGAAVPVVRQHLEAFDKALGGQAWLAGRSFSIADMMVAPPIYYMHLIPEEDALLSGLDELARWYAAIGKRLSFWATQPELDDNTKER